MTLKTFDINYGFNGEPSTASITVAGKIGSCNAGTSSIEGSLNSSLKTGNSQIDALIKDYIISSKEEVIQAGFKEIKYQLVDKQAKRLASIAVLVRGITASSKGDPFKNKYLIYDSSEVNGKGGYNDDGISIRNNGRVAIIGKSFSTISATKTFGEISTTATKVYNRGASVFTQPSVITDTELTKKLKEEETIAGASLRHGYYISELQSLITQCGYSVSNFPTGDRNLILDFGGSLKDCISSLASMFGLFYICRGNKITFYRTSELKSLSIPNFNNDSDPTILSCSFSEDLLGKQTVGVIRGSVAPNNSNNNNTTTLGFGGARSKTINFYKIDPNKAYNEQQLVATMFSMFRLGDNKELFDRIIMSYKLKSASLSDASFFSSYNLPSTSAKKLSEIAGDTERNVILQKMPWLNEKSKLYKLPKDFKKPSETELYGTLSALCKTIGGLYVSQGVSSLTARDFTVTASEGFLVSEAYEGKTKLSDVKELQGVVGLFSACGQNVKDVTLDSFVKTVKNTKGTPLSRNYYIGIYDLMHKAPNTSDAAKAIKDASNDMRGTIVTRDNGEQYFAVSGSEESKYENVINTSKDLYSSLASAAKNQVRGKATEMEEETSDTGGENEEEDAVEYPANYVSFVVRAPSDNSISDISIAKFEGTVDEASYMSSNFNSLVQDQFNSKKSSVTYSGLRIPSESPFLVNVSVQFSAGTVQTSIEYSNVEFVAESSEVIMSQYAAASKTNILRSLTAKQKNALGLN